MMRALAFYASLSVVRRWRSVFFSIRGLHSGRIEEIDQVFWSKTMAGDAQG